MLLKLHLSYLYFFKALEASGKLEKEHLANLSINPEAYKLDLPPSYDDVADLHVAVPLQAEELPRKEKPEAVEKIQI